ncbi:MAG: cytidylyltransferase domain-containing protein [Bradymonadia bacterium]
MAEGKAALQDNTVDASASTTGVIVLARLDSRRLPGKALAPIGPRPLLGHVFDRVKHIEVEGGATPQIVLATSTRSIDEPIACLARSEDIPVFRGSADDVARRCLDCAITFGFERFVRVCGDSPFFNAQLTSALLKLHEALDLDVTTNVMPRSFPAGASVEIVSTAALARALDDPNITDADREHVTAHFYRHPLRFRIHNVSCPAERYKGVSLAVDTPEDLVRTRWVMERLPMETDRADLDTVAELTRAYNLKKRQAA